MSRVSLSGNPLGSGTFTIASPNSNTDRTLTLPNASGTLNVSGAPNEVPAGSAAAPAIYPTGDTNTGIFFPAADTIAFAEGGGEAMRLDASGNVLVGATVAGSPGLGVANSANISFPESTANTSFATMFRQASSADLVLGSGVRYSGTSNGFASSTGSAWARTAINVGYGAIKFFTAAEATVTVGTDTTLSERARITSGGSLLVGTATEPTGSITGANIRCGSIFVNRGSIISGSTSVINLTHDGNNYYGIMLQNASANNSQALTFVNSSGTAVGSVVVSTTATVYNTSSDYRLKNTIAPMTGALAKVALLKPCTYKWKANGSSGQGFIAHELAEVVPDAVTGEKDGLDSEGNPKYQGIDTSFLVATLTAAIQELKADLDATKAELAALKGQA
jgi:hypothetical protein